MCTFDFFVGATQDNQFALSNFQIDLFRRLWVEFRKGNQSIRLVSSNDLNIMPMRHFFDSITPLFYDLIPQEGRVLDIGSGGGLPGLPLAICCPEIKMTLIDSNRKKMSFVRHVVRTLALNQIRVLTDRVENLHVEKVYQKSFDVCVARAVTSIDTLVKWGAPLLKINGRLICFKGPEPDTEIDQAEDSIASCHCIVEKVLKVKDLDKMSKMCLVIIKKEGG
ncbi:MAG TPA: 16S rRNA (guanine(527)-N(7))-methyltransferase RsmG [candidate division Zixibacteria bacterium]|nr:16S rRNA (guanine(527)-N(7))-methyltransferase RsmG [candidate division Zixibacteria bacterium]